MGGGGSLFSYLRRRGGGRGFDRLIGNSKGVRPNPQNPPSYAPGIPTFICKLPIYLQTMELIKQNKLNKTMVCYFLIMVIFWREKGVSCYVVRTVRELFHKKGLDFSIL